jgi:hypothetical protein
MRRLLALLAQWFTTEHGVCLLLIVFAGTLAIAPLVVDNAAPLFLPPTLAVPAIEDLPLLDPARTADYAAAHETRSYLYLAEIGRGRGSTAWDPGEFAGAPFLAQWDTRALSPFSLPVYLFGARAGLWIAALLKITVAGALAFYVARVLGFTHAFALFVAVSHALNATLVIWTADPTADAVVWVPMIFLFAERLSLGQSRYWPGAAIVIGLMCLSGAPQAITSTFAYFMAYFLYRRAHRAWKGLPGPALSAAAAVGLGLGIAAVQLLPWLEWLRHSRAVWTAGDAPGWVAAGAPLGPLARLDDAARVRAAAPLHAGYVPLLLAGLWLVVRPEAPRGHRRRVDGLLIISAVWLAAAVFLAALQPHVPALQPILLRALVAPYAFGLSLGGAAAAEAWLQLRPAQSLSAVKRYLVVVVAFVGLTALSHAAVWPRLSVVPRAPIEMLSEALTLTAFVLVLGITLVRPWPRLMGYALSAATALELLVLFVPLQPRTSWAGLIANPPGRANNAAAGRVTFGPGTESAGQMAVLSPMMGGFGPRAPERVAAYLQRAQEDPLLFTRAGISRFVLSLEDLSGPYAALRPQLRLLSVTAEGAGVFDYTPGAQPTRLIHDFRVVSSFDPALLDSGHTPLVEAAAEPGRIEGRLGKPLLMAEGRAGEQRVNVFQNDPGVLTLAQTFYPDWSARVDGATARVFAVDGAFQGIELSSGSREAVFRYSPAMFRWGLVISSASLSLSLLGLAHLVYFRLKNQFFKM